MKTIDRDEIRALDQVLPPGREGSALDRTGSDRLAV